jgi:hypothetical protein
MKKSIILSLFFVSALICKLSASTGKDITSEVRTSAPFHSIDVLGDAELVLIPSDDYTITLEGTGDQLMNMVTLLKNDTLFIVQTNKKDKKDQRTKILVNVNDLSSLHVKGKTNVSANGYINTETMNIRAEEGAAVNLDLRASKSKTKLTGYMN